MGEGLSVEVDALDVRGGAHVEEVPAGQLLGVHPEALQAVNDAVDGCGSQQHNGAYVVFACEDLYFSATTSKFYLILS